MGNNYSIENNSEENFQNNKKYNNFNQKNYDIEDLNKKFLTNEYNINDFSKNIPVHLMNLDLSNFDEINDDFFFKNNNYKIFSQDMVCNNGQCKLRTKECINGNCKLNDEYFDINDKNKLNNSYNYFKQKYYQSTDSSKDDKKIIDLHFDDLTKKNHQELDEDPESITNDYPVNSLSSISDVFWKKSVF